MQNKVHEYWIDNIKIFACILVVLGHFIQSMTKSGIMQVNNYVLYFDKTIYFFHVQLFFICSGYLYQKHKIINNLSSWANNMLHKLLALGIPYVTFSSLTWLLKTVFSSAVNDTVNHSLLSTLFESPVSPYWYLYCLIFIFLITPTFSNARYALYGFGIALILRLAGASFLSSNIYAINIVLSNEIWFVLGMLISFINISPKYTKRLLTLGCISFVSFLGLCMITNSNNIHFFQMDLIFGLIACLSIMLIFYTVFRKNRQPAFLKFISNYTMPIFLMHTLFAASLRTMLLKIGVVSLPIHIILGITISFIGPILATIVMKKTKILYIFLYPLEIAKLK